MDCSTQAFESRRSFHVFGRRAELRRQLPTISRYVRASLLAIVFFIGGKRIAASSGAAVSFPGFLCTVSEAADAREHADEAEVTPGIGDPIVAEFASLARQSLLAEFEEQWLSVEKEFRKDEYPAIEHDPFFTTDLTSLLSRYLIAAQFDLEEALKRLSETAKWRRDWDVLSYYEPRAAERLFNESSNPGAEMYFADALTVDRLGRPYVAGRLLLANSENMHPWNHLRAGVLVFERMATKVARIGRGPGSYILDIGSVGNAAGSVSGTGGLDRAYDESKNPYYAAGAGTDDAPSPAMLQDFGSLDNGFAVLKAAIAILNRHYPGVISRVFYLNSNMLFWGAFKIFSRWIADRGSIEFHFLGPAGWREQPVSTLLDYFPSDQLFREWGGSGPLLEGDEFLARAIAHYESEAAAVAN